MQVVDTQPTADTLESYSFLRRDAMPLVPAAEFLFHVETDPYVLSTDMIQVISNGVQDIVQTGKLDAAISSSLDPSAAQFKRQQVVEFVLRITGVDSKTLSASAQDVASAVTKAVATTASVYWSGTQEDAAAGHTDFQMAIIAERVSAQATAGKLTEIVASGTLVALLKVSVTGFESVAITVAPEGTPAVLAPLFASPELPTVARLDGVQSVAYRTEASTAKECAADTKACLVDGQYTFLVRAVDTHGNVGNPATHAFIFDSTPPRLVWKQRPRALANARKGLSAKFDFQSNEIDVEGRETCTFKCRIGRGFGGVQDLTFADCGSLPVSYTVRSGQYTFQVQPTDAAGNLGAVYTYQFEVDGTIPVAQIASGRPPMFTRSTAIQLQVNTTEQGTLWCGVEYGDCIIDDSCGDKQTGGNLPGLASYTPCLESIVVGSLPALRTVGLRGSPPTLYRLRVLLEDQAGNLQVVPETVVWTIDTVAPLANITAESKPLPLSALARPQIVFEVDDELAHRRDLFKNATVANLAGTGDTPAGLGLGTFYAPSVAECILLTGAQIDEFDAATTAAQQQWGWAQCSSPYDTGVETGRALFSVRAFDAAGNVGARDTVRWVVNSAPPILRHQPPEAPKFMSIFNSQGQQPAPRRHTQSRGVAIVALHSAACPSKNSVEASAASSGTVTMTRYNTSVVVLSVQAPNLVGPTVAVELWGPVATAQSGAAELLFSSNLALTAGVAPEVVWRQVNGRHMQSLVAGSVYAQLSSGGACLMRGRVDLTFSAYFEFYSGVSAAAASATALQAKGGGESTRFQCCVDNQCASTCRYCHAARVAGQCARDCTTVASQKATRCDCGTVAQYDHWPPGYNATSVVHFAAFTRVKNAAWSVPGWDCPEGGRVLDGLADGDHEFSVRTVDKALHVSSSALVHKWTIDATPPVVGLIRAPPARSNGNGVEALFYSNELGAKYTSLLSHARVADHVQPQPSIAKGTNVSTLQIPQTSDGRYAVAVQAVDQAGNRGETQAPVTWVVDRVPPTIAGVALQTIDASLHASVQVEHGASIACTLSGTLQNGSQVSVSSCGASAADEFCPFLTVSARGVGLDVMNLNLDGPYLLQYTCGAAQVCSTTCMTRTTTPCLVNSRPVYEHRDHGTILSFDQFRWKFAAKDGARMFADTGDVAARPNAMGPAAAWSFRTTPNTTTVGGQLDISCGFCGSRCKHNFWYRHVETGQYTLCVAATDDVGNTGAEICSSARIVTAEQQILRSEAAALKALAVSLCTLTW